MELVTSTKGVVQVFHPSQGMDDLKLAGFENCILDLSIFCSTEILETIGTSRFVSNKNTAVAENPSLLVETALSFYQAAVDRKISFPIVRAPYLDTLTNRTDLQNLLLELSGESLKLCHRLGCKYCIVQPLFAGIPKEKLWEVNKQYFTKLGAMAEQFDVMILLENQCRNQGGHLVRGICAEPSEAISWLEQLNAEFETPRFGFSLHVGNCNLCGQNMDEVCMALGSRIKAVLLLENDAVHPTSAMPFTLVSGGQSRMDWLGLIRGLRAIDFDGIVIFDFSSTASAFSVLLKPELLKLAYKTGIFFLWQIEMERNLQKYPKLVLFGAGNMCRNYMKCYGETFPPLFTCDNNAGRWGTSFEGLEVHNPEDLKQLSQDTAICVCNMFYREVEVQLREMGIQNPIIFFNDEYLPSYYTDRLEQ